MKVGAAWFRSAYLRRGSASERPPNKAAASPTARHSKGTGSGSGSGTGMRSEGEIPCEISRGITESAHPARPRLVAKRETHRVSLQKQRKNSDVVSESACGVWENGTFSEPYRTILYLRPMEPTSATRLTVHGCRETLVRRCGPRRNDLIHEASLPEAIIWLVVRAVGGRDQAVKSTTPGVVGHNERSMVMSAAKGKTRHGNTGSNWPKHGARALAGSGPLGVCL